MDCSILYTLEHLGCASVTLKDEQTACVKAIYEGNDVILWLPTGFGKSMCYEVLPFVFDDKLEDVTEPLAIEARQRRHKKNPCRTPIIYYNLYVRSAMLST